MATRPAHSRGTFIPNNVTADGLQEGRPATAAKRCSSTAWEQTNIYEERRTTGSTPDINRMAARQNAERQRQDRSCIRRRNSVKAIQVATQDLTSIFPESVGCEIRARATGAQHMLRPKAHATVTKLAAQMSWTDWSSSEEQQSECAEWTGHVCGQQTR